VWRSNSAIAAAWRTQDNLTSDVIPLHKPFWTTASLTRARAIPDLGVLRDLGDEAPLTIDPSRPFEPPVWDSGFHSARARLASMTADALEPGETPMSAPVWASLGGASALPEEGSTVAEAVADEGVVECEPPIWSSFSDRTP
jgi:hypothetical protein